MSQRSSENREYARNPANDNLIDGTMELWRRRLRRDLQPRGRPPNNRGRHGLFGVLIEWAGAAPANDDGEPRSVCPDARDEKST